jgi:uncharacterized damage-inducible protein DinB
MNRFYQDYLDRLEDLHKNIEQAIQGLPQEALDWSPGEGMNSIDVLVVHLTGAERYWIGDVAAGEPSGRDRSAEFRADGLPFEVLQKRLYEAIEYARNALNTLTLQDLGQERVSQRDGRKFSVSWALLHAIEHAATHLGHIQLTCQLWDAHKQ